jgi:hypothetical protein
MTGESFALGEKSEHLQRIEEFLGIAWRWPDLGQNGIQHGLLEAARWIAGRGSPDGAAGIDRTGAPLLRRAIVQEGIGPRVDDFRRQGGGCGQIAAAHADCAGFQIGEQSFQPRRVHDLFQTVAQGLGHQGMIRNLALALEVLQAGELVRKHPGAEILGVLALELRRAPPAALAARDGQGRGGDPAPASGKEWRIQQRLDQHTAHAARVQIAWHVQQVESMGGP